MNILPPKTERYSDRFEPVPTPKSERYHEIRLRPSEEYRSNYDSIFRRKNYIAGSHHPQDDEQAKIDQDVDMLNSL